MHQNDIMINKKNDIEEQGVSLAPSEREEDKYKSNEVRFSTYGRSHTELKESPVRISQTAKGNIERFNKILGSSKRFTKSNKSKGDVVND